MKNLLAIITLSICAHYGVAQKLNEKDVPAKVKEAFSKQYPNAKVEKWEKENSNFEAEFMVDKIENSVLMDSEGAILQTEKEIKVTELPQPIVDYINKNMPGKKVKEASEILGADGNMVYEAEINNIDYIFNSSGVLLRQEQDKEKDDKK